MRIREATAADIPALTEIHRWAVEETVATFTDHVDTVAERGEWLRARQRKGHPVLVAESTESVEGTFFGYASYDQFRPSSGYRHSMEHSVYVSPAAHGRGIGSALMDTLIDRVSADEEVWTLVATVEGTNIASLRLHEKMGFTERGRLPGVGFKFGRRLDLVYLVRDVPGPRS